MIVRLILETSFFFFKITRWYGMFECFGVSVFRCSGVRFSGVPDFKICLARLKESNMADGEGFKEMTAYFLPYMYLRIAHWWKLVLLTIPSENLRIYSLFCNLWLASLIQRNERYERPVKLCIQVSSCTIDWYDPFCIGIFSLHSLGLQVKENCLVYKEIQHVGPNNINERIMLA